MKTSFLSSLRSAVAVLVSLYCFSSLQAQVAFSDNFQYGTPNGVPPFTTTYTQVNNGLIDGMQPAGTFSITSDLARDLTGGPAFQTQHPALTGNPAQHRFFDHTFGNAEGLYLAVNGDTATNIYGMAGIAVTPNTDYVFSVWMNSWTFTSDLAFGRVRVNLTGNNSVIGDIGVANAPPTTSDYNTWGNVANWTETVIAFNSGANTTIDLALINDITETSGNDYSIDDISITAVPEPTSFVLGGLGITGIGAVAFNKVRARQRRKMLAKQNKAAAKA